MGHATPSGISGAMREVRRVLTFAVDAREAPDTLFGGYKHTVAYLLANAVGHWATHCKDAAELIAKELPDAQQQDRWFDLAHACQCISEVASNARDWEGPGRSMRAREDVLLRVNEFLLLAGQALHAAHSIQEEYKPLHTKDGY